MPLVHHFQPFVDGLLNGPFPGSSLTSLEISEEQSSLFVTPHASNEDNDRFKLHIPYAGHTLVWEVRFNAFDPKQGPDFIFDDESFTLFLNVEIIADAVPSLLNWNPNNANSLAEVVQQLLDLYTQYQLDCLGEEWSTLKKDCLKLQKDLGMKKNQIQVLQSESQLIPNFTTFSTSRPSSRPSKDTVSLALLHVEAQMDFESLLEEFYELTLLFTFQEYGAEDTVVMHMNPVLQLLLGDKIHLVIPNYFRTQGLYSYVKNFKEIFTNTLNLVVSGIAEREEFHETLLFELEEMSTEIENFTFKAVDFDSIDFLSSSYLLSIDWFTCLLHAETASSNKPKITIRTITTVNFSEVELDSSMAWDPHKILKAVIEKMSYMKDNVCSSF